MKFVRLLMALAIIATLGSAIVVAGYAFYDTVRSLPRYESERLGTLS